MIHLLSSIYVNHIGAKHTDTGDVVTIGDSKNVLESVYTTKLGRYDDLGSLDVPNLLVRLDSRILEGRSEKVIIYIAPHLWSSFMARWIKTLYRRLDDQDLSRVFKLYRSIDCSMGDRSLHFSDGKRSVIDPASFWVEPDWASVDYYDLPDSIKGKIGLEYFIANAILGDDWSKGVVYSKIPSLYRNAVNHELNSARMYYDIGVLQSTKNMDQIVQEMDSDPVCKRNGSNYRISTMTWNVEDLLIFSHGSIDTPLLNDIKRKGRVHEPDELIDDLLGSNELGLLVHMKDMAKLNIVPLLLSRKVKSLPDRDRYLALHLPVVL